jgi:hypothetical protein
MKMSAEFILKQHLRLNINGVVKNFIVETLENIPPQEEWRNGRIWYNKSENKIQYNVFKTDDDGNVIDELVVKNIDDGVLNFPKDQTFLDGLFQFTTETRISDAVDEINEALKDLAPAEATTLRGDLIIKSKFVDGYLSDNVPNEINLNKIKNGDYIKYIVFDEKLVGELPKQGIYEKNAIQKQFGKADDGIIDLFLNNEKILKIDLGNNFYEKSRDIDGAIQGYDYPIKQNIIVEGKEQIIEVNPNKENFKDENEKGKFIISKIEKYNNFKKFQKGEGNFELNLVSGENDIFVMHENVLGGPYKTNELEVFYDNNADNIEMQLSNINVEGDKKYLSGIEYLNDNIKIHFDLNVKNLFKYTFNNEPIKIKLPYIIEKTAKWNNDNSNLKDKQLPNYDDELSMTDYVIDYDINNIQLKSFDLKVGAVKPSQQLWKTENINKLLDTKNKTSIDYKENFDDEYYRLEQTIDFENIDEIKNNIGKWDSSKPLDETDAQLYLGKLIKAQEKFDNVDYSNNADKEQVYIRPFIFKKSSSNGEIAITTKYNLNQDFDIYMKLPNVTGWLDLSKYFDVEEFENNYKNDGTGCLTEINKEFDKIFVKWTIGTHSLNESENIYLIKIVLKNKDINIDSVEEISNNLK